ncbi:MAG: DEDD exonuclease domain-containing protein [Propionibacteriaceae bacterium]|nr:DEDD exonuclease domain-containing protein [Propionibacteriaceae bacterium]
MTVDMQPSLLDLGTPLREVLFCVVDLETTGTGPESAITEIGAVLTQGGQARGELQTMVNPAQHVPGMITVLTGITDAMVEDAPPISAVLPSFLEFARGAVLVAHNARFDVGFLQRAAAAQGVEWPAFDVVDTVAVARQALHRDEVRDVKLSTLARFFHAATQPDHRALSDARATVDVLYGLFERLGNLGVTTLDDLAEFTRRVSPARRAKRVWAKALPPAPGVYWFYATGTRPRLPDGQGHEVLYVGKSGNLARRVATYFTASETRSRMDEMVRVAAGVDYIVCATPLEAEVRELRLIAAHQPRYNRRSRRQDRLTWVKLTAERFPRFSVVRQVGADDCQYWGPFTSRLDADDAMAALQGVYGLRTCSLRLGTKPMPECALGEMGRCLAPCRDPASAEQPYSQTVETMRQALLSDIRPTLQAGGGHVRELSDQQRFEEAADATRRLNTYRATVRRWHRLVALGRCRQIVAARLVDGVWQIHVIRHGFLAGAAVAPPGTSPRQVAEDAVALAATVLPSPHDLPAGTVEEAERIADWLETPGTRLIEIDGEWSWPVFAGVDDASLPRLIWEPTGLQPSQS